MKKMATKGALSGAAKQALAPSTSSKASSSASSTAAPIQAMQLLGRWTRMAQGQIPYGMGCSCCTGFDNVQVKDMEQHILDYLDSKYRAAGSQALCALIAERANYRTGQSGSITDLLRAIAMQADKTVAAEEQLALLGDLGRSIDSLDELMRSG